MKHLHDQTLALLAGGDLSWAESWMARRHLRGCPECLAQVSHLRSAIAEARGLSTELPPGLDWEPLAAEMHGNIRVGLEAAACVAPRPEPSHLDWRAAVAVGALMAVVMVGWYLNSPRRVVQPFARVESAAGSVLVTPAGLEISDGRRGVSMLNPGAGRVTYTVDPGGARAQYLDSETGNMTITRVLLPEVAQ
jgi:hypothetical protein